VLIIVVIIAAAGYYYWSSTHPKPQASFNAPTQQYGSLEVWRV
jgi:hypothetical protein